MAPEAEVGAGLPGSKKLHEHLQAVLREDRFGGLLLFDIDRFHRINQERGTRVGDQVIARIEAFIAGRGLVGYRIGGDQFGVVVESEGEKAIGEEFCRALCQEASAVAGLALSVSGGGVHHPGADFNLTSRMHEILHSTAQQLLIKAKQGGRNRILWLPDEPAGPAEVLKIGLRFYRELARVNSSIAREMEVESRIDFLTGLANRRGFEDALQRWVGSAQRRNQPLALLYMDSDSLKKINDSHGHDAGDRFIVDMASVLTDVVRGSDFISRWGSDEFAVLMDEARPDRAQALAERIRQAIEERTGGTVSVGVYCGIPQQGEEAVRRADRALYRAKAEGKNQVQLAEAES